MINITYYVFHNIVPFSNMSLCTYYAFMYLVNCSPIRQIAVTVLLGSYNNVFEQYWFMLGIASVQSCAQNMMGTLGFIK